MDSYDVLFKFSDFVDFLKKKKWQLESEDIKKIRLLERMQKDEHVVKWLEQPETSRHYSFYTTRRLGELNRIKENLHIPILQLDEKYIQTYIQAWFYNEFEDRELESCFPDHLTCSSSMLSYLENQKLIRVTWNTWLRKDHPRIEITKKGLEADGLDMLRNVIPKPKPIPKPTLPSDYLSLRESSASKLSTGSISGNSHLNFENLDELSWQQAEDLVASLFEKKGYDVEEIGVTAKDGTNKRIQDKGIDVKVKKDQKRIGIQVKHQKQNVKFDDVAKTLGVAKGFTKMIVISTKSGFTPQSLEHAKENRKIELWDCEKFKKELEEYGYSYEK